MRIKVLLPLSFLVLVMSACGVDGDKLFSANANDDLVQVDLTQAADVAVDVLGNDGGSGRFIEDFTQGYYGSVAYGSGGLTLDYSPNSVSNGTYMTDWFEYRIRTNNNRFDVGRVSVRFTEFASDRFEPDDFQEYARPITLRYGIPYTEDHTSDVTNAINPAGGSSISGQTIGGDEDWFIVEILAAPTGGLVPYLNITTVMPGGAPIGEQNALVVGIMDQWGFILNEAPSGTGPGVRDTELDVQLAPGTYFVRLNPETGHKGSYDVTFEMYEAAPLFAPPVGVSKVDTVPDEK